MWRIMNIDTNYRGWGLFLFAKWWGQSRPLRLACFPWQGLLVAYFARLPHPLPPTSSKALMCRLWHLILLYSPLWLKHLCHRSFISYSKLSSYSAWLIILYFFSCKFCAKCSRYKNELGTVIFPKEFMSSWGDDKTRYGSKCDSRGI